MDHLLKESKEQPEKVRPFIRFFFLSLDFSLILSFACLGLSRVGVSFRKSVSMSHACHKACVPYDTRAVSFNMRRDL